MEDRGRELIIPPDQETTSPDPVLQVLSEVIGTMGAAFAYQAIPEKQPATGEYSPGALHSGMQIPDSPARALLQEKLTAAHHIERANDVAKNPAQYALANLAADSVCEVEGITMIEPGDYGTRYHRCVQYAFGAVHGREWAQPHGQDITMDFWNDTTNFLLKDGYELVDVPQEGDIIVYANEPGPTVTEAIHVSVLGHDGRATAKFNQGPIVEHPIDLVPLYYGSYLYFFRRD